MVTSFFDYVAPSKMLDGVFKLESERADRTEKAAPR